VHDGDWLRIAARNSSAARLRFSSARRHGMFKVSVLIWMILGTAIAGTAVIAVLAVPSLAAEAMKNIPFAVLIGFAAAMPLSYLIARQIGAMTAR
jgi:preprotein translocase subunit SecF